MKNNSIKKYIRLIIFTIVLLLSYTKNYACIWEDSLWNNLNNFSKNKYLYNLNTDSLDSICFTKMISKVYKKIESKKDSSRFLDLLNQYGNKYNKLPLSLIFNVVDSDSEYNSYFTKGIEDLFIKFNGSLDKYQLLLENKGDFKQLDSVYEFRKKINNIGIYDRLKSADIKCILGKFDDAVEEYCKVELMEPKLSNVVRIEISNHIKNEDKKVQNRVISTYINNKISSKNVDSISLRLWLSRVCHRYNLYKNEVDAIYLFTDDNKKDIELFEIAKRRFYRGLYKEVIYPAFITFNHSLNKNIKNQCAILIYQSYLQMGNRDSSLVWIKFADLKDYFSIGQAVILYQYAGLNRNADSLISILPNSIRKDTLIFRQYLFKGNIEKLKNVLDSTFNNSLIWNKYSRLKFFWRYRIAVMTGNLMSAIKYSDSIKFDPSWSGATEYLRDKVVLEKFVIYSNYFKKWGQLQYLLFVDRPEDVIFKSWSTIPFDIKEDFVMSLVRALGDKKLYKKALSVVRIIPEEKRSSQLLYYEADLLINSNKRKDAVQIFKNLVLNYSTDIFSHKARIYLQSLGNLY